MYYSQKKYTTKPPGNIQGVYNKGTAKKEANGPRKPTIPKNHLYPIQVKKSIKDLSLSPLYTLDQYHQLQMNKRFILWAENISLSKVTLFLSPQTVQKRQRGAALQSFFRFFPTKREGSDERYEEKPSSYQLSPKLSPTTNGPADSAPKDGQ